MVVVVVVKMQSIISMVTNHFQYQQQKIVHNLPWSDILLDCFWWTCFWRMLSKKCRSSMSLGSGRSKSSTESCWWLDLFDANEVAQNCAHWWRWAECEWQSATSRWFHYQRHRSLSQNDWQWESLESLHSETSLPGMSQHHHQLESSCNRWNHHHHHQHHQRLHNRVHCLTRRSSPGSPLQNIGRLKRRSVRSVEEEMNWASMQHWVALNRRESDSPPKCHQAHHCLNKQCAHNQTQQ